AALARTRRALDRRGDRAGARGLRPGRGRDQRLRALLRRQLPRAPLLLLPPSASPRHPALEPALARRAARPRARVSRADALARARDGTTARELDRSRLPLLLAQRGQARP